MFVFILSLRLNAASDSFLNHPSCVWASGVSFYVYIELPFWTFARNLAKGLLCSTRNLACSYLFMETYGTIYLELPAITMLRQTEGGAAVCLYFSFGVSRIMDKIQPVLCDEDSGKEFILCEYNRDADSYRSPWSNKFHPHLDDGMYPSEELRKLEVEANEVFTIYRDQ
ncbi:probable F-actin-capping protein subunit beta [Tanacetum coccineum]